MTTAEYVEECLGKKLAQRQKDYMDYLDKHPDTEIMIPRARGVITGYELWLLGYSLKFWNNKSCEKEII